MFHILLNEQQNFKFFLAVADLENNNFNYHLIFYSYHEFYKSSIYGKSILSLQEQLEKTRTSSTISVLYYQYSVIVKPIHVPY